MATPIARRTRSGFDANGGAVFLHDQSEFNGFDETDNLNGLASALGVGFRFNDDQVEDETNNSGVAFVPTTGRFNTEHFPFLDSPTRLPERSTRVPTQHRIFGRGDTDTTRTGWTGRKHSPRTAVN